MERLTLGRVPDCYKKDGEKVHCTWPQFFNISTYGLQCMSVPEKYGIVYTTAEFPRLTL